MSISAYTHLDYDYGEPGIYRGANSFASLGLHIRASGTARADTQFMNTARVI